MEEIPPLSQHAFSTLSCKLQKYSMSLRAFISYRLRTLTYSQTGPLMLTHEDLSHTAPLT